MRRTLAAFAVVALFATLPALAAPTIGECEANDASGSASAPSPIGTPAACQGTLTTGDADFYAFDVKADETIALLAQTRSDTVAAVTLYNPAGTPTPCADGRCTVTEATNGTWKFSIVFVSGGSGPYALALATTPGAPNTTCDEPDAGDTTPGTAVTPPMVCGGAVSEIGDEDWFSFTATEGAVIVASSVRQPLPGSGLTSLKLKAPNGTLIACTNDAASACSVTSAAAGTWHLGVVGRTPTAVGSYVVALAIAERAPDAPSLCEPQEASPDKATATERGAIDACNGRLATATDVDMYKFVVDAPAGSLAAFTVSVTPANGSDYDVAMFDDANRAIACENPRPTVCTNSAATGGAWYIRIAAGAGTPGAYVLSITTVTGDPDQAADAVRNLAEETLRVATCEPSDAGSTRETAASLRWTSSTETGALCRGSVAGTDTVDVYRFRVHTDNSTVRVLLQPEAYDLDLTLSITPPPGACEASERVGGQCPSVTSQLGRDGQPDFVEKQVAGASKSGDWIITIGRAPGETGGFYELGVHVQNQ